MRLFRKKNKEKKRKEKKRHMGLLLIMNTNIRIERE